MLSDICGVECRPCSKIVVSNGVEPCRLDWAETCCVKKCNVIANSVANARSIVSLGGCFEGGGNCPQAVRRAVAAHYNIVVIFDKRFLVIEFRSATVIA